jgi:hypothetical protein
MNRPRSVPGSSGSPARIGGRVGVDKPSRFSKPARAMPCSRSQSGASTCKALPGRAHGAEGPRRRPGATILGRRSSEHDHGIVSSLSPQLEEAAPSPARHGSAVFSAHVAATSRGADERKTIRVTRDLRFSRARLPPSRGCKNFRPTPLPSPDHARRAIPSRCHGAEWRSFQKASMDDELSRRTRRRREMRSEAHTATGEI